MISRNYPALHISASRREASVCCTSQKRCRFHYHGFCGVGGSGESESVLCETWELGDHPEKVWKVETKLI
jgi:hypothetical protein